MVLAAHSRVSGDPTLGSGVARSRERAGGYFVLLRSLLACVLIALATTSAFAQAQTPPAASDAARALAGVWELSNPDRDRRCTLSFKLDASPEGRVVTLGATCPAAFPDVGPTRAEALGTDD